MAEGAHKHDQQYQLEGIPFTLRERDVFACIVSGRSSRKSIANILKISPATVASYMRSIMQKLQCSSVEHVRLFIELSGEEVKLRSHFQKLIGIENRDVKLLNSNCIEFPTKASIVDASDSLTVFTLVKQNILIVSTRYYLILFCMLILVLVSVTGYISPSVSIPNIRSELIVPEDKYLLRRSHLTSSISRELYKRSSLKNNISIVTLVGIGGAGKTTLSRLVARKHHGVTWEINAETKTTLMKSLRDFAYYCVRTNEEKERIDFIQSLAGEMERQHQLLLFIKDKLREHPGWLLIYDNVESLESIKEEFPFDNNVWGQGHIIITTRNENIKLGKCIKIEELQEAEIIELFQNTSQRTTKANDTNEKNRLIEFLRKLPPYPLDIAIAGKYLYESQTSEEEYLLRVGEKSAQNEHRQVLANDSIYNQTRYDIIDISLNRLIKENPRYIELFLLISYVESQNIPSKFCEQLTDKRTTQQFMRQMKDASLLTTAKLDQCAEPVICLHRSIQDCIGAWLKNNPGIENRVLNNFFDQLVLILEAYIHERIRTESYEELYKILSHIEKLINGTIIPQRNLVHLQGVYGCLLACLEIYTNDTEKCLELYSKFTGSATDYKGSLVQYYYGYVLGSYGKYEQSIYYIQKSLQTLKKHNFNSLEYFYALCHLSCMYRAVGRYTEAKQLIDEGYKVKELYPKNYRAIAENIAQKGLICRDTGKYQEALVYLNDSVNMLAFTQKTFSTKSQPYFWLQTLYVELGYFHQGIKGFNVFGDNGSYLNQDDAKGYSAVCHYYIGEFRQALKLLEAVYVKNKKTNYIHNYNAFKGYLPILGRVYIHFSFYDKARKILEECLRYSEELYGKEKFQSARTICYLGELDMAEGNLKKAEQNMLLSYRLLQEQDHTDMYVPLESLAELYLRRYQIAKTNDNTHIQEECYKQAQNYLHEACKIIYSRFSTDSMHVRRIKEKMRKFCR